MSWVAGIAAARRRRYKLKEREALVEAIRKRANTKHVAYIRSAEGARQAFTNRSDDRP